MLVAFALVVVVVESRAGVHAHARVPDGNACLALPVLLTAASVPPHAQPHTARATRRWWKVADEAGCHARAGDWAHGAAHARVLAAPVPVDPFLTIGQDQVQRGAAADGGARREDGQRMSTSGTAGAASQDGSHGGIAALGRRGNAGSDSDSDSGRDAIKPAAGIDSAKATMKPAGGSDSVRDAIKPAGGPQQQHDWSKKGNDNGHGHGNDDGHDHGERHDGGVVVVRHRWGTRDWCRARFNRDDCWDGEGGVRFPAWAIAVVDTTNEAEDNNDDESDCDCLKKGWWQRLTVDGRIVCPCCPCWRPSFGREKCKCPKWRE